MSVVGLAVLMPVLLIGVLSSDQLRLFTKADEPATLKVWTEPNTITAKPGQSLPINVLAEYDEPSKLIPKISLSLVSNHANSVSVSPDNLFYSNAFTGKVILGKVIVTVQKAGEYEIKVAENSVNTGIPDLQVSTIPTTIHIRE